MASRSSYQRGRPWGRIVVLSVLLAAAVWLAGLVAFARNLPGDSADDAVHTDAVVVLTGGSGRLDEGLRLMTEGKADKLFISGVYKGMDVRTLMELTLSNPDDLSCCISIGYAEDTIANALETGAWVKANQVESLRLVTSAYHMPRAVLEFEHALSGVDVILHPVFADRVKQDDWWRWPGTRDLIVSEYNKYLLAWGRHRILGLLGFGAEG